MNDESRSEKDFWDKIEILVRPVGALLSAAVVALIGYFGSNLIERQQNIEANVRLYSELMTRREEAESALRKDMLQTVIESFLKPEEGKQDYEKEILHLELLAQNFHESLNITPLFSSLEKRIDESSIDDKVDYLHRLERVGREVGRKQLLTLEGAGVSIAFWTHLLPGPDRYQVVAHPPAEWQEEILDGVRRRFRVTPLALTGDFRPQLRVRLETLEWADGKWTLPTEDEFRTGYFDFPLVDNTRLSHDQRSAVVLTDFKLLADQPAGLWARTNGFNYRDHLQESAHQRWHAHSRNTSCTPVDSIDELEAAFREDQDSPDHARTIAHLEGDDPDLVKSHAAWEWHRISAGHAEQQSHYWPPEHQLWQGHMASDEHQRATAHVAGDRYWEPPAHTAGVEHQEAIFHMNSDEHRAVSAHAELADHQECMDHEATEAHRWYDRHTHDADHVAADNHLASDSHIAGERFLHIISEQHLEAEEHAQSDGHRRYEELLANPICKLDLKVILFPGSHASLKEKPYYEDIIQQLRATGLYGDV